jgi:alkylation response protein AidB-like acyl-CoA dehydrogenase
MQYQDLFMLPVEWINDVDRSIAESVAGWADREVMSRRLEYREDYDRLLEPAMKSLFVDIGLQSMIWPEESGGGGIDSADAAMTLTAVLEQVGRADSGIGFLFANAFALHYSIGVEPHRNEALLEDLKPIFCESREPALCSLVLPFYGTPEDKEAPSYFGLPYQASARKSDGGWAIEGGDVRPQCAGANASVFAVICSGSDGEPACLVVPADAKGLTRGDPFKKTGLAASINAEVDLDGVTVPDSHLVFKGIERLRSMLCCYYLGCSAVCVGGLLSTYEILKEWGDTRVIKGKGCVFKNNPLVAALMGDIGGNIAACRILLYNLARMLSEIEIYGPRGRPSTFATATAVTRKICSLSVQALNNSMELMASAGYATEWNLERYWRDIKTIEAYIVPETAAKMDMARHYFGSENV